MLNTTFQYYPTGFRIPLLDGVKQETTEDPELEQILKDFRSGKFNITSFEFYDRIVVAANRLLGDFVAMLDANDTNPRISEQGYLFLADTIQFINTGRRPVSINGRLSICATEFKAGIYENKKAPQRKTMLRNALKVPARDVVFQWIRHHNGMTDMLCTLQFLFATDFRK